MFAGWLVVAALCVLSTLDGGFAAVFSAFVKPLAAEFGWTRAQVSAGFSLYLIATGCSLPFWGWLADRKGTRIVYLWSAVIDGVALWLLSSVETLTAYYAAYLLLGIGLGGIGPATIGKLVCEWFVARRGLAMGIALGGSTAGGLLLLPLTGLIITSLGWSAAYRALSALALGGMLPVIWLLIVDRPSEKGLRALGESEPLEPGAGARDDRSAESSGHTLREALSTPTFWCIGVILCLGFGGGFAVTTHQVAFLEDAGFSLESASTVAGLTLGMNAAGRLLVGWVTERVGHPHRVLAACLLVQAAGIAVLLVIDALGGWAVAAFTLLCGLGMGGVSVLYPLTVGYDFGRRAFAAIAGALGTVGAAAGGALGPIIAGRIFDETGSYHRAFALSVGMLLVAAVVAAMTPRVERG